MALCLEVELCAAGPGAGIGITHACEIGSLSVRVPRPITRGLPSEGDLGTPKSKARPLVADIHMIKGCFKSSRPDRNNKFGDSTLTTALHYGESCVTRVSWSLAARAAAGAPLGLAFGLGRSCD